MQLQISEFPSCYIKSEPAWSRSQSFIIWIQCPEVKLSDLWTLGFNRWSKDSTVDILVLRCSFGQILLSSWILNGKQALIWSAALEKDLLQEFGISWHFREHFREWYHLFLDWSGIY
nr:uncharacterized protein LOC117278507 isoform X2 [Nicotiana tomentosiformis]